MADGIYGLLADLVTLVHLGFVAFVVLGGFLAWRWNWLPWIHLPAAAWGAFVELTGRICPLTPLEVWLRHKGDAGGYSGGFVEHYLLPLLYPSGLTHDLQLLLGGGVIVINALAYAGYLFHRARRVGR